MSAVASKGVENIIRRGNTVEPNSAQETLASRSLRSEQNNSRRGSTSTTGEIGPLSKTGQIKQQLEKEKQLKKQAQKKAQKNPDNASKAANLATTNMLRLSWLNLIDSFGLTLIYINLHVFLHWVLGDKFFCKLGDEWIPKEIKKAGGESAKAAGKAFGIMDVMLLILLDVIIGALIFGILAIIVMIVTWMGESWWGKLKMLWNALWGLGWGGVQVLIDLFS